MRGIPDYISHMAARQRLMAVFQRVSDAGHPRCAHAERLISRAAAELASRPAPGRFVACATPIRLTSSGDDAVSVSIDTPAEVDAAGLVRHLLEFDGAAEWQLVSQEPALPSVAGQHLYSVTLSYGSLAASLEIPHSSAPDAAASADATTRLQPGELRFTAPQLSMTHSRLITSCAQQALLGPSSGEQPGAVDAPLAALSAVLRPLQKATPMEAPPPQAPPPPQPPQPPQQQTRSAALPLDALRRQAAAVAATAASEPTAPAAPSGGPFRNPSAERASAANAAAWGTMKPPAAPPPPPHAPKERDGLPRDPQEAVEFLEGMGARVVLPPETPPAEGAAGAPPGAGALEGGWAALAGAAEVQREVEEALLLPLQSPEAYAAVLRGTRAHHGAALARPAALLFHGPPGTGKTSAARIAAGQARLPLVYAPLEALVSKWFGRSEQQLAALFESCEALGRRRRAPEAGPPCRRAAPRLRPSPASPPALPTAVHRRTTASLLATQAVRALPRRARRARRLEIARDARGVAPHALGAPRSMTALPRPALISRDLPVARCSCEGWTASRPLPPPRSSPRPTGTLTGQKSRPAEARGGANEMV